MSSEKVLAVYRAGNQIAAAAIGARRPILNFQSRVDSGGPTDYNLE
jgi:hypothetical protein